MRHLFALPALTLALAMVQPLPAAAFDMGPLGALITEGSSPPWTVSDRDGAVVLENTEGEGAIRYYYLTPRPGTEGRRSIEVTVDMAATGENGAAGLLYGYQAEPRSYWLFRIDAEGRTSFGRFSEAGYEQRMGTAVEGVDGPVTLGIEERGDQVTLTVDGQNVGGIGNSEMGRGGVGIVATGTGVFTLSDFSVMP